MKLKHLWKIYEDLFGLEEHQHNHVVTFTGLVTGFFVLTSVVAMILTPRYSFTNDFLSTLGTSRSPYPYIFNIAVVLTAILLIPTYFAIHRILLRNIPANNDRFLNAAFIVAIISSIALAGVGILPAEGDTLYPHAMTALAFFLAIGTYYVLITFLVIRILNQCHNFRQFLSPIDYVGFAFIVLVLILVDIATWYSRILQKSIVYGALLFLAYVATKIKRIDHLNQVIHGWEVGDEETP